MTGGNDWERKKNVEIKVEKCLLINEPWNDGGSGLGSRTYRRGRDNKQKEGSYRTSTKRKVAHKNVGWAKYESTIDGLIVKDVRPRESDG